MSDRLEKLSLLREVISCKSVENSEIIDWNMQWFNQNMGVDSPHHSVVVSKS